MTNGRNGTACHERSGPVFPWTRLVESSSTLFHFRIAAMRKRPGQKIVKFTANSVKNRPPIAGNLGIGVRR